MAPHYRIDVLPPRARELTPAGGSHEPLRYAGLHATRLRAGLRPHHHAPDGTCMKLVEEAETHPRRIGLARLFDM